jgi:hypothetical protein
MMHGCNVRGMCAHRRLCGMFARKQTSPCNSKIPAGLPRDCGRCSLPSFVYVCMCVCVCACVCVCVYSNMGTHDCHARARSLSPPAPPPSLAVLIPRRALCQGTLSDPRRAALDALKTRRDRLKTGSECSKQWSRNGAVSARARLQCILRGPPAGERIGLPLPLKGRPFST